MLISSLARAKSHELVALLPMAVGIFLRPDMLIVDARIEVEGDLLRLDPRYGFIRFVIESHTLMTSFPSSLANAMRSQSLSQRQKRTLGYLKFSEGECSASVGAFYVVANGGRLWVFDGLSGQMLHDVAAPASNRRILHLEPSEDRRVCFSCGVGPDMHNFYILDAQTGVVTLVDRFNPSRFLGMSCMAPSGNLILVSNRNLHTESQSGLDLEEFFCTAHNIEALSLPSCRLVWKIYAVSFNCFEWSPYEDVVAIDCDQSSVRLLDVRNGSEINRHTCPHHIAKLEYSRWSKYATHLACTGHDEHEDPFDDERFLTIFQMSPNTSLQEVSGVCRPLSDFAEGPCYFFDFVDNGAVPELVLCFAQMDHGGSDIKMVDANTLELLRSASVPLPVLYLTQALDTTRLANKLAFAEGIEDVSTSSLLPGTRVEAHSLTREELNGKFGRIQGRQGDRFQVMFEDAKYGGKALKASNLRVAAIDVVPQACHSRTLPLVHIHPPARIDQEEAAEIVAQQEAGWIERLISSTSAHDDPEDPSDLPAANGEELWKIELKRCPQRLLEELSIGTSLRACREALENAGLQWNLPDGNALFVNPCQYKAAMRALAHFPDTIRFSIFFVRSFEHLIEETLSSVGQGAVAKTRSCQPLDENGTGQSTVGTDMEHDTLDDLWCDGGVQRTFIHMLPRHIDAHSVVQSSTEVHGGGTNPRRVLPLPDSI
mmetsp:Transcript_16702/g.30969  ORF Transcript_16702/g.30969 Transcript_16702/m.30969 type:complete len:713 (-) Transcript_16702:191-2329(-)